MRRIPLLLLCALCLATTAPSAAAASPYLELVGAMHEHSAYSDGWPGTRPLDVFKSGKGYGLDFLAISDHSTNLGLPSTFNESCYGEGRGGEGEVLLAQCVAADGADSRRKWDATAEQATETTDGSFAAIRGFEWSSDRFGHLNVLFSRNWVNEVDGAGYADMRGFWRWFTTSPDLGGGADGLGTFNHPSAKKVDIAGFNGADTNWNDFAYVPEADERMVGLEVFNDKRDYGSRDDYPEGAYAHALDKGWHVGAIAAEDLGHRKPPLDNWGGPEWPKTVILAADRTPAAIRAALLARRFYAVGPGEGRRLRLDFRIDGAEMGSRLVRAAGEEIRLVGKASAKDVELELVTSGGRVVAKQRGRFVRIGRVSADEKWFFVRARRAGTVVGYTSPIWIERAPAAGASGEWLGGDGHVHTCYSHDSWCPPNDETEDGEVPEVYSTAATVPQRFAEAAAKGLDFLTISDHNDVRAWSDPGFGSLGVLGVHAYEHSLGGGSGHAHVIGGKQVHPTGDAQALAAAAAAEGALFQINHPTEDGDAPFTQCSDFVDARENTSWDHGFSVRPDTLEVWNATTLIPPAEMYWECWLQQGWRVPVTSGSDSHGGNQANLGIPTEWVFARERSEEAIIEALRAGRTTITRLPPALGAARLLLEADADRNGSFEAMVGDTVPPGVPMRARSDGLSAPATLRVRANGTTLLEKTMTPGVPVEFAAPASPGWVRASLLGEQRTADVDYNCRRGGPSPYDICTADLAVFAMTSPIYLEQPGDATPGPDVPPAGATPQSGPDERPPAGEPGSHDELDGNPPMTPAAQSLRGAPLPAVPRQAPVADLAGRTVRAALPRLVLSVHGRSLALGPRGTRFDVQVRRGAHWSALGSATTIAHHRLPAGARAVRARVRLPDGRALDWATRKLMNG